MLANSFNPLAAILIACLILKEVPTVSQLLGGSIILLGVGFSAIAKYHDKSPNYLHRASSEEFMGMGFKGI